MHSYHTYIKTCGWKHTGARFFETWKTVIFYLENVSKCVFRPEDQPQTWKCNKHVFTTWPHIHAMGKNEWFADFIKMWLGVLHDMISKFVQGRVVAWNLFFSTYNHDLMFSWPILYSEQIQKTVLEKLAAPDFLKLYHHKHFFEHLVFKKRRVMFWSAPENICSPWFSQDVIKFSLTWYKTFWIVWDLYFAALNFKYMNYTSWPHVVFDKYGRYWVCAASAFSRYENLGWLSLDSMCIPKLLREML